MDGARPDDDQQAIVVALEDTDDLVAGAGDDLRPALRQRKLLQEDRRWKQGAVALDMQVAGLHRRGDCIPTLQIA